jgi:integrase
LGRPAEKPVQKCVDISGGRRTGGVPDTVHEVEHIAATDRADRPTHPPRKHVALYRTANMIGAAIARLVAHKPLLDDAPNVVTVEPHLMPASPMADLSLPSRAVSRDRVLDDAELATIWKAAAGVGWPFGAVFQLLILTAARRDEIGSLCWTEIAGDTIRLSRERSKNAEPRAIPISAPAAEIIKMLPRFVRSDFVFSTTGTTAVSGWSRAKRILDAAATKSNNGTPLAPWRVHDLRRSVATGLQRLGTGLQTIEAVLGHVTGSRSGVVGTYQRYAFEPEARAALQTWGEHIGRIVSTGPASAKALKARR